jgi:hypothetical protein
MPAQFITVTFSPAGWTRIALAYDPTDNSELSRPTWFAAFLAYHAYP